MCADLGGDGVLDLFRQCQCLVALLLATHQGAGHFVDGQYLADRRAGFNRCHQFMMLLHIK